MNAGVHAYPVVVAHVAVQPHVLTDIHHHVRIAQVQLDTNVSLNHPAIPARHLVGSMVLQEDNVMMLVVLPMAVSTVK